MRTEFSVLSVFSVLKLICIVFAKIIGETV